MKIEAKWERKALRKIIKRRIEKLQTELGDLAELMEMLETDEGHVGTLRNFFDKISLELSRLLVWNLGEED